MEKRQEIDKNWIELENFDVRFCVIFDYYYQY